jgi:hypothetical protein
MTRGAGFGNADLDVNITRDPKFRRLARLHPDLVAAAFAGYVGILTDSWGSGERKAAIDAWPEIIPWSDDVIAALQEVELLDAQQKVSEKAWNEWFGAACARREKRRQAGSEGGKQKASNALARLQQQASNASNVLEHEGEDEGSSNAVALLPQGASKTLPVRPSVRPSDSPIPPQAGARSRSKRAAGTNPRANGRSLRQLLEGTPQVDANSLASLAERTAKWNAEHPSDPLPIRTLPGVDALAEQVAELRGER